MFVGVLWFAFRLSEGSLRILPVFTILNVMLVSPVAEEILFRGILQKKLRERISGGIYAISYGNMIASVIFALVHVPFWGVLHSFLVFAPSLIFGFLYDRTGKITYGIFLHIFYNANVFIV